MCDGKVFYQDTLDQDRTSQAIASKEVALAQTRKLHRQQRAEICRIESSDGGVIGGLETMRWIADSKQ
jgi:hypothetical protein